MGRRGSETPRSLPRLNLNAQRGFGTAVSSCMVLAALAIDEADDGGDHRNWQKVSHENIQSVNKAGNNNVFTSQRFNVGNTRGCFGAHAGVALFSDTGTGSKFSLGDAGTKYRDRYACAFDFVLKGRGERQQKRLTRSVNGLEGNR